MVKNDSGLHVTADKVLIRPFKVEEKTSGGIVLPQMVQDKEDLAQQIGELIAWGSTAKEAPELEGIELGDTVLFPRYQGGIFPVNGIKYQIMRATSILGKCDKLPDFVIRGAMSSSEVFGVNVPQAA